MWAESDIIVSEFNIYTELRKIKPNTYSYPGELPVKLHVMLLLHHNMLQPVMLQHKYAAFIASTASPFKILSTDE